MGQIKQARLDEWAAGVTDLTGEEARAVATEVRRLRREARSRHCGCGWCCSNNADGVIPGDAHLICSRYATGEGK